MTQSILVILFLTFQGWAMEPYYPEKIDPKVIELPKKMKVKYTWRKIRIEYPSLVLFNSKAKGVFF